MLSKDGCLADVIQFFLWDLLISWKSQGSQTYYKYQPIKIRLAKRLLNKQNLCHTCTIRWSHFAKLNGIWIPVENLSLIFQRRKLFEISMKIFSIEFYFEHTHFAMSHKYRTLVNKLQSKKGEVAFFLFCDNLWAVNSSVVSNLMKIKLAFWKNSADAENSFAGQLVKRKPLFLLNNYCDWFSWEWHWLASSCFADSIFLIC